MSELLLLSGGFDSIALAAWRRPTLCLTVDYGQIAAQAELHAAAQVCNALDLAHRTISIATQSLGSGDLAGKPSLSGQANSDFWPFRNQLLLTLASVVAIQAAIGAVVIGSVVSDARHVDGTPEFVRRIDQAISIQEGGIRVLAPAIELTTTQLILKSGAPRSLLAWAHSCHVDNIPCGTCKGCRKHIEVLQNLAFLPE